MGKVNVHSEQVCIQKEKGDGRREETKRGEVGNSSPVQFQCIFRPKRVAEL